MKSPFRRGPTAPSWISLRASQTLPTCGSLWIARSVHAATWPPRGCTLNLRHHAGRWDQTPLTGSLASLVDTAEGMGRLDDLDAPGSWSRGDATAPAYPSLLASPAQSIGKDRHQLAQPQRLQGRHPIRLEPPCRGHRSPSFDRAKARLGRSKASSCPRRSSASRTRTGRLDGPHAIILPWLRRVATRGTGPPLREGPPLGSRPSQAPPGERAAFGASRLGRTGALQGADGWVGTCRGQSRPAPRRRVQRERCSGRRHRSWSQRRPR